MPEEYDPKSNAPKQLTSREILKIMYNPSPFKDAFRFGDPKPDALKVQPPWNAELLLYELNRGQVVSRTLVREAVKMLFRDSYVKSVPGGNDLTEKGKREAERLGAKPIQRSASG
jgi:hypothetical protein